MEINSNRPFGLPGTINEKINKSTEKFDKALEEFYKEPISKEPISIEDMFDAQRRAQAQQLAGNAPPLDPSLPPFFSRRGPN